MASDSPELLGDLYIREFRQNLVKIEEAITMSFRDGLSASDTFFLTVTVKLTRRVVDEEGRRSADFSNLFSMPVCTLVDSGTGACNAVAWMLSQVHLPYWGVGASQIVERARRFVNDRPLAHHHNGDEQTRAFHMQVYIDAFVDELPAPSENDNYAIMDDDFSDFEDDDVEFVPASKEAIESLEKIKVMEKEVACPVCLDDVSVGSEATRLPCSHLFHGDCIVKWLQNSKFCPLCRLEISS